MGMARTRLYSIRAGAKLHGFSTTPPITRRYTHTTHVTEKNLILLKIPRFDRSFNVFAEITPTASQAKPIYHNLNTWLQNMSSRTRL